MNEPTCPAEDTAPPPPLPQPMQARIEFLFRGERRRGLIHPLQPILQRYRAEADAAPPGDQP
jgi:hypothetical protein